jgi:hypothetical protein
MIHIVFHAVRLLNYFLMKGGVSDTLLSPKTILSGETLDYKKHLHLQIGQYCQVHKEDTPRNSQWPRTKEGAICLGPSGNLQGGFKFMALSSGKKIIRRSWDAIPMPDTVIACVNALGSDQPEQLIFTDRHGRLIGDTEFPGAHFGDNDEPPSEMTLNIPDDDGANDDADLPGVDDAAIPGVDNDVELPGVDGDAEPDVELPGVDGDAEPAPNTVEIMDLNTTTDPPIVEAVSFNP